jgi:intein/homing endonuclease/GTPase SAR1 family protein
LFQKKKNLKIGIYGPPNAGKCVAPETQIVLQDGQIKPIKEIFDNVREREGICKEKDFEEMFIQVKGQDIIVPSLDQETLHMIPKRVSFVYAQKYKGEMYTIQTRNGRNIRITPVHPLIRVSDTGVEKVMAMDLLEGETVAICKKVELTSSLSIPVVSQEVFIEHNGTIQSKAKYHYPQPITYPQTINAELVRFIGYVITESHHAQNRIKFSNTDEELLKDFVQISKKLFNVNMIYRTNKGVPEIEINAKTLTDFLENNLELKPALSGDKKIPSCFMGLPKNLTAELLQVLFDCEASVPLRNGFKNSGKEMEYCSKSKILVEQVQILLNRFGIVGKFKEKIVNGESYWRLLISGSDQHRMFRDNIGFKIKEKQNRLHELCKAGLKRNKFSLPIMRLLDRMRQENLLLQKDFFLDDKHIARMKRENKITYHRLEKMAEKTNNQFVKTIANGDTAWDEILSIKKEKYEGYIYDLTIEDTHTFMISNGLIAHNTTLANRICKDWLGEELGVVSPVAHETREIQLKEKVTIKSKDDNELTFSLIDTPGIATKVDFEDFMKAGMKSKEAKERAKEATKGVIESIKWLDDMDVVIVVLDATQDPYTQVNITIIGNLQARDIPVLVVANKVDLKKADVKRIEAAFPQYDIVAISAKTGTNIDQFYEGLFAVAG